MIDTDCSWWYTNRQNSYTVVCILIAYINFNNFALRIVGMIAISIISTISTKFLSVFTVSYIIMNITYINKFVNQFVRYVTIMSFSIMSFSHLLCSLPTILKCLITWVSITSYTSTNTGSEKVITLHYTSYGTLS